MRETDFHRLIDGLYEAALEPDLWPAALLEVATAFAGPAMTIVPFRDPSAIIVTPGSNEAHRAYLRDWWQHDTILAMGQRMARHRGLVCDWVQLGADTIATDPFYQEFRRPFGMGSYMGFMAEPSPGEIISVGLQLRHGQELPGEKAQTLFTQLGRHATRALSLTVRSTQLDRVQRGLAEAIAAFDCGVAVIDGRGRVILANSLLEALADDGLAVTGGALRAARAADQKRLDLMLQAAMRLPAPEVGPDFVLLARPSGRRPLLARAMPMPRSERGRASSSGVADGLVLVLVIDLAHGPPDRPSIALRALGLTPAEARVAACVGLGRSPREAAEAFGIAEGTARVLLKHAYQKLEISRQAELARLVTRLAALAADAR